MTTYPDIPLDTINSNEKALPAPEHELELPVHTATTPSPVPPAAPVTESFPPPARRYVPPVRTFTPRPMPKPMPDANEPRPEGAHHASAGPVFGTIIIVILLIFGALYFWGAHINQSINAKDQVPLIPGDATSTN